MLASDENKNKALRVYVEAGGCSGMQYGMVFDEKRADDVVTDYNGVSLGGRSVQRQLLAGFGSRFQRRIDRRWIQNIQSKCPTELWLRQVV